MALVPLTALSPFELLFSFAPLEAVVGATDPFHTETPVKAYRRPTRKRGRLHDKTIKKLPSTLYFAHEPLDKKPYPAKIRRPQGGLINTPPKMPVKPKDSDDESSDDNDSDTDEDKSKNEQELLSIPSGRNARIEGGRPAKARKITADLDSDDELLVRMKLQGRTDKEIAQALIDSGRVKYNMKTVGSRWKRIRIVLAKQRDADLEKKIAKWSEEEDQLLLQAFDLADQTVARLKKEAEDSRWTIVLQKLKVLKVDAIYSIKACRERYEALQNGTATLPVVGSDDTVQQVAEQDNEQVDTERMEVDEGAPSTSAVERNPRPRSDDPAAAAEDGIVSDEGSTLSETVGNNAKSKKTQQQSANPAKHKENRQQSASTLSGIDLSAITNLPFKAQIASASIGRKAPNLPKDLKDIKNMNRDELREELRMRGLCSDGLRPKMEATLRSARAGNTDLKPSPTTAMIPAFNRRAPKPIKRSAGSRLSTLVISDTTEAEDIEQNDDHGEGPQHKRAKTADSTKKVATGQLSSLTATEAQNFQGATLADQIFSFIYLPLTDTNTQLVYQEEVDNGRRVFLSNVPSDITPDAVRGIIHPYKVEAIHTLKVVGNLVIDCADVETAVSVTSALDGLALKGQAVIVENAQVVAQKYFPPQNQAQSTKAPSTKAPSPESPSTEVPPVPTLELVKNIPKLSLTKGMADRKNITKALSQLLVKNVPSTLDAQQMQQIFGKNTSCEPIEIGVWLLEFPTAAAAEKCLANSEIYRVQGQALKLEQVLPQPSESSGRRQPKQEIDVEDEAM